MEFLDNESIMSCLTQLTQKIDRLTQKVDNLTQAVEGISHKTDQLDDLTTGLKPLTASCSRMDTHIDFVDAVYSTVRRPLDIVLGLVGGRSASRQLLPVNRQSEEEAALE